MIESRGREGGISAHMNVLAYPMNTFFKYLKIHGPEFATFEKIIAKERIEFSNNVAEYKRLYDPKFKKKHIPCVVFEGTGIFNPIDEIDPYIANRQKLRSGVESIRSTKFRIFHPVGDPKQFFLNILSLISPYFIKKYNLGISTFVMGYSDMGRSIYTSHSKVPICYGITYNDFIRKSSHVIEPKPILENYERDFTYVTTRRNIRNQSVFLREELQIDSLEDVAKNIPSVHKLFQNEKNITLHSPFDIQKEVHVIDGADDSLKMEHFRQALVIANNIKNEINTTISKRVRKNEKFDSSLPNENFLYVCLPSLLFYKNFVSDFVSGLINPKLPVVHVNFTYEIFGEVTKNIVFIVTCRK